MGEITIRRAELWDGTAIVELVLALAEERGAVARSATSLAEAAEGCLNTPHHEIWVAEAGGSSDMQPYTGSRSRCSTERKVTSPIYW